MICVKMVDSGAATWFTQGMNTNERTESHKNQGHEVWVTSGVVRCLDCDEVLDTSGHRPGLVESNQSR